MLEQHLELVLVRARHDSSAAALLYLDVDGFKQANDTYGHEAGDQLLCDVATRLRAAARSGELVVRLGGDEFVVVLGDLPAGGAAEVAKAVADRAHEGLAQPFDLNGTAFQSSASIGIALFPEDGADAAALLTAADTGMYVSKRAGRGRTSFPLGSRRAA
jgi:diguanylate cyclase (GGDEF)-like protein